MVALGAAVLLAALMGLLIFPLQLLAPTQEARDRLAAQDLLEQLELVVRQATKDVLRRH
jgi:hypothetical protein